MPSVVFVLPLSWLTIAFPLISHKHSLVGVCNIYRSDHFLARRMTLPDLISEYPDKRCLLSSTLMISKGWVKSEKVRQWSSSCSRPTRRTFLLHSKVPMVLSTKSVTDQHHKSTLWRRSGWKAKTMAFRPPPSVKYPFSKNSDTRTLSSRCMTLSHQTSFSALRRLRDVILTDARLYLIFEYLAMDLKKYLDCLGETEEMDAILIRVRWSAMGWKRVNLELSRVTPIKSPMLYSSATAVESSIATWSNAWRSSSSSRFISFFQATKSSRGHERHH